MPYFKLRKAVMIRLVLLALFITFGVIGVAHAETEYRVVWVADGDTIHVEPSSGGERLKIRLWGVDCPESKQRGGATAKKFVIDKYLYKTVYLGIQGQDQYGRTIAVVYSSDSKGKTLQEDLLQNGLAWVYPQYCRNCKEWEKMQRNAADSRKGLWKDLDSNKKPVAPWVWRKEQRR